MPAAYRLRQKPLKQELMPARGRRVAYRWAAASAFQRANSPGGAALVSRIYFGVARIGCVFSVVMEVNDCLALVWHVKCVTSPKLMSLQMFKYTGELNCTVERLPTPAHFQRLNIAFGSH